MSGDYLGYGPTLFKWKVGARLFCRTPIHRSGICFYGVLRDYLGMGPDYLRSCAELLAENGSPIWL